MAEDLRQARLGSQTLWTKAEVLGGLEHFFKLHGRYPTAREIDKFEFLPSSRSIQRQFGGLVALRTELIPDSHSNFTQGDYRSSIARRTYQDAVKYEEEFYSFLCIHFDPVAIHEHKIIRPGNVASDFFIYFAESKGIIIDLFYAKDLHSLNGVVNIKRKKYAPLPFKSIFLLMGNNEISIEHIKHSLARRKIPLPPNILVDTEDNFKINTIEYIKKLSIYSKK